MNANLTGLRLVTVTICITEVYCVIYTFPFISMQIVALLRKYKILFLYLEAINIKLVLRIVMKHFICTKQLGVFCRKSKTPSGLVQQKRYLFTIVRSH